MSHRSIVLLFAALTTLACSTVAFSHDPENNPGKAVHGGQYVEFKQHHGIELVVVNGQLIFHITEHLQPMDMTGSTFMIFIQTDAGTQTLALNAEGPTLVADFDHTLPKRAKIVLTGKDDDGRILQARFVTQ